MLHIYTDGAASNNKTKCGGWAFAIYNNYNDLVYSNSGGEKDTTNNRMELIAIINGIKASLPFDEYFTIYTDSAYINNCIQQKWYKKWESNGWINSSKKPVLNKDLWIELLSLYKKHNITFEKVKGHSSCIENCFVDKLAVMRKKEMESE